MKLELRGLCRQYGKKTAVDQLSLEITPGVYGLLGANGAGKTTLMRMICGVLNPTGGSIALDGHDIRQLDEKYRNVLGYLPQDFGYYPDFTAWDFMLYVAALKGVDATAAKRRTEELLHLVSLSDVANRKIRTYSGGMKQRLGIAQAVVNDPQILVLDEPTAGLDPKERVRFRNLISDFAKDKVVILSTHIVSDIEYIADTILIMKSGKLLLCGPMQSITDSIEQMVWSFVANRKDVDRICETHNVANLQHIGTDTVKLRIISEEIPFTDAQSVTPTLEDLYLYHFQTQ